MGYTFASSIPITVEWQLNGLMPHRTTSQTSPNVRGILDHSSPFILFAVVRSAPNSDTRESMASIYDATYEFLVRLLQKCRCVTAKLFRDAPNLRNAMKEL